jgi:hypothetical protein
VTCIIKVASRSATTVRARLTRGAAVYARGSAHTGRRLTLSLRKPLRAKRYRLTLALMRHGRVIGRLSFEANIT